MKLLFLFVSLFCLNSAFSQNIYLFLKDKISGQPVEYARMMVKSPDKSFEKSLLSDEKGEITLNCELPVYLVVSTLGYKLYIDTVKTPGQITLLLTPDYYQLDNVVVTGQYRPQSADRSIYKINIIESHQMKFKTAGNLDDLLKKELSFQNKNEGALGNMISIHGLTGEYVKVLMDGMPVTGREYGFIDLSQVDLCNVDHIEIVEGPMSIIYGNNALAGAINIITSDYSGNDLLGRINAQYESAGIYNFNGTVGKRFHNQTFIANFARNFYSDWSPYDTSRYQIIKPKLQYIAGATYHYGKKNFRINYTGNYVNEELRDLGSVSYSGEALDSYYYTTRLNNTINLANKFRNNFTINLQAGYSYYQKRKITYNNDLVNLKKTVSENVELSDTTRFNLISCRGLVSNITGKKFEYQSGFESTYEFANGKRMSGYHEIYDLAGFLSFIYRPIPKLSLQPGLRAIYNSKYKGPLVYAINLKYNPGSFVFRASYAKGFSAPSLKQLYLQFTDNNHQIFGNENLKSETANNFNLSGNYSLTYEKHSISVDVTLFYNAINNAIQLAIDTTRPGWGIYFNVKGNHYKTKGIETTLTYNYSPRITLNAGTLITGSALLEENDSYNFSTDYTSSLVYRGLKYKYEIGVYYKYTGKSEVFAGNFNADHQLIGVARQSIGSYNSMDILISKTLMKDRFTLACGIKNLFNVTMIDSKGSIDPHGSSGNYVATGYGRTYMIKVSYQFDKF